MVNQPAQDASSLTGLVHARLATWALILAVAVPFGAYLATMPPDITFEDAGIFALSCYTGGLAHPPGYPLHTLLCLPFAHLDSILPISPAMGTSIFSALANSLCAATLAWIFRQFFRNDGFVLALALAYAFGMHSWSQSIIPEVYTLNALLFFLTLALTLRFQQSGRVGFACAAALVAGLGLSNHWPLFLFAAPSCLLLLLRTPDRLRALLSPRIAAVCVALFALGLLPYARMFFIPEDAYAFQPINDFGDFLRHISRSIYLDRIERIEVSDRFAHMFHGIPIAFEEHPLPTALVALLGIWACWNRCDRWLFAAMLWMLLSALVLLKLAAGYFWLSDLERHTFAVYHQIAFGAMAYFMGEGWHWMLTRARMPERAFTATALILPLAAFGSNYGMNQRHNDTLALRYAELAWETYPANALVEVTGDIAFPVRYLGRVHNLRPDVELVDLADLLGYDKFTELTLSDEEMEILTRIGRPLVLQRQLTGNFSILHHGTVEQVIMEPNASDISLDPPNLKFMGDLVQHYKLETDAWNRNFSAQQVEAFMRLLESVRNRSGENLPPSLRQLYLQMAAIFPGQLGVFFARVIDGVNPMTAGEIVRESEGMRLAYPQMPSDKLSLLLGIEASAFALEGDHTRAKSLYVRSIKASPSAKENPAVIDLLQLYALNEEWEDYRKLRLRYRTIEAARGLTETDRQCAEAVGGTCKPAATEDE